MASVFRVFYSKINLSPDKATKVVLAAVVLHNMLRTWHANTYTPPGFADKTDVDNVVEDSWRNEVNASIFQPLPPQKFGNNSKQTAKSYFAISTVQVWCHCNGKHRYNNTHWKNILLFRCTSTSYKSSHPELFFKTDVPKQLANSLKNNSFLALF